MAIPPARDVLLVKRGTQIFQNSALHYSPAAIDVDGVDTHGDCILRSLDSVSSVLRAYLKTKLKGAIDEARSQFSSSVIRADDTAPHIFVCACWARFLTHRTFTESRATRLVG